MAREGAGGEKWRAEDVLESRNTFPEKRLRGKLRAGIFFSKLQWPLDDLFFNRAAAYARDSMNSCDLGKSIHGVLFSNLFALTGFFQHIFHKLR